eukprot:gene9895-2217_t
MVKKDAHPRSRKAEQLNRKTNHDKRKNDNKINKQKKTKPKLERFKFFLDKIKEENKTSFTKEEIKEFIDEYLEDKKLEMKNKKKSTIQEELIFDMESKEINSNQLELPDLTDEQNVKLNFNWSTFLSNLTTTYMNNIGLNFETLFIFGGFTSALAIIKELLWNYKNEVIKEKKEIINEPDIELFDKNKKIKNIKDLEEYLNEEIMNQKIAIKLLYFSLLRNNTIWNDKELPLSYFFIGSKNSGKIYLSKKLSESLNRPFLYFDLNYYKEEDKFNELIYFKLSKLILKYPNSIIIFNNFEKGNKIKFNFFDKILNLGEIESLDDENKIETINCKNIIFIFSSIITNELVSNLLSNSNNNLINNSTNHENNILDELNEFRFYITPLLNNHLKLKDVSFLNRINLIVPFFQFSNNELFKSFNNLLKQVEKKGKEELNLTITWSESVIFFLIKKYRPTIIKLNLIIENHILNLLALNYDNIKKDDHIHLDVDLKNNKIILKYPKRNNFYFDSTIDNEDDISYQNNQLKNNKMKSKL